MFKQSKLDFIYARNLNETAKFWKEIEFQQCQIDRIERMLKLNLISIKNRMALGRKMKGSHIERAGEVLYIHRCTKLEVTFVTKTFCTRKKL